MKDKEKQIILTEEELKKIIQEEYRNALKDKVVLTKKEYNALIAEYKAITYKYDDICDRYRLCKDANETIKQHAVMTRKETVEKFVENLKSEFPIFDDKITFIIPEKLHRAIDEIAKTIWR